ncbi:MAG: cytochrome c biogenesis protein CcdA [Candidatus Omnitrophota bacterium]
MENISIAVAFTAGLISFLNPCVLPLVPGFLGYLCGVSLIDPKAHKLKVFLNSLFFVLGFSCVFAAMGVLLNTLFQNVSYIAKAWLGRIGGSIIILFGLHLLGLIKIGFLERGHSATIKKLRVSPFLWSFIFGAVFGISWTPCVGAILGSVLALALAKPALSFFLLLSYALGLGLPFLLVGAFSSFAQRAIQKAVVFLKYFNIFSGVFLLILGVLVFTDNLGLLVSSNFYLERRRGAGPISAPDKAALGLSAGAVEKSKKYERAKELIAPDGFINSQPFKLSDFIGKKVILLDFWTYSCINCQRTLPYLKAWYEKYKAEGFVIVGVHSPEFEFEKQYDNVLAATQKWGITYPVALDRDHRNLELYNTIYWPSEFLIDIDGFVVYKNIGEGHHKETEFKIQELLDERKRVLGEEQLLRDRIPVSPQGAATVDFLEIGTPEIYLGSSRNKENFGNQEAFEPGATIDYHLPNTYKPHQVYIDGAWYNGADHLELKSTKGKIVLIYTAKSVNVVAGSFKEGVQLRIKLDGKPVAGVFVKSFDLYKLVSSDKYGQHRLEINVEGEALAVYAFTFG